MKDNQLAIDKLGGVFYFQFVFEDEENDEDEVVTNTWGFNLTPEALAILGEDFVYDAEWYAAAFEKIEGDFGVHDWSSSPCDAVIGIGYTTYEVSREDAPACVELWRQEFVNQIGEDNVSQQVYNLGEQEVIGDLDAFNRVANFQRAQK